MRLDDTRVLLTGASTGIGRELACRLAGRGAVLAIAARRGALLEELARDIAGAGGREPIPLSVDLARPGAATELAAAARRELGRVEVLINNAGSNLHGCPSAVGDRDEARGLFELNFWSPLALVRELVPEMRQRGDGMVANVTSLAVVAPFPAVGHYCSSKAALSLATQSLRLELRGSGVEVLEVLLGPIDTDGSRDNRTLEGAERWLDSAKPGRPEKAAAAIARAIERGRRRLIYPRRMRPSYELPLLGRLYSAAAARGFEPERIAVRRTGWRAEDAQPRPATKARGPGTLLARDHSHDPPSQPGSAARLKPMSAAKRETQITVLGLKTRVIETGPQRSRDALLFVHGMPGSALDWERLQDAAGELTRTISFDMPGFGVAAKPADTEYSFSAGAVFIAALVAELGVERVHLVAHDSGGVAGLVWAAAHPTAFLDAVLLCTGVFVGYRWHPLAKAMRTPLLGEILQLLTTRKSFERGLHDIGSRLSPTALDRLWDDFDRGTRRAMRRSYRASPPTAMERLVPTFRALDRPALVIWGAHDTATPAEQAQKQRLSFPSVKIETLDCGHWPHLEKPDQVAALAVPFLRERVADAGRSESDAGSRATP